MKHVIYILQTSLDTDAAALCDFDPSLPIPAPLSRIDAVVLFEVDYGNGASRAPLGFCVSTLARGDAQDEAELIRFLDMSMLIAQIEPGTACYCYDNASAVVFYRGIKHGVELNAANGTPALDGRAFGIQLTPRRAESLPPETLAQVFASLGIPRHASHTSLDADDPDYLRKHGEIEAVAGWLLCLMLENASDPAMVRAGWNQLGAWIEADPSRSHLRHFAHATDGRRKPQPDPEPA